MNKPASPVAVIVAIVVAVLVVGGLYYKFLGPGSHLPAPPETIPGATGQTGGTSAAITEEGRPRSNAPGGIPGATGG
jgi:hypothetical protein